MTVFREAHVEMPFEINGFEYLCTVYFDYSPYYAGDKGSFGKEGRTSWGTPEEPEEYTINKVLFDERLTDMKGKVIGSKEHDFSWILEDNDMVEDITQYLIDNKE